MDWIELDRQFFNELPKKRLFILKIEPIWTGPL